MSSTEVPATLAEAAETATALLSELEQTLRQISDGELHLADTEGGWTCAQVVSHIHLSGLLWIADLERMRHDESLLMFREEVGHDVLGAPPPTSAVAAERIASLRVAVARCLPAADPAVLDKTLEINTLGTRTVGEWTPVIIGHLSGHRDQIVEILRARGAAPGQA